MEQMLLAITVYNCEGRIIKVLNQLDNSVMKYFKEILILDTDSTDRTKEDIRAYQKKHKELPITVLSSASHPGQGSAVKKAFCYAEKKNYRYLIMLRGDNQTDIHDFLPVLKGKIYKRYDFVLGARFMKGSRLQGYSKLRIWGNILMNIFYTFVCKKNIYDIGAGINLYSVSALNKHNYLEYPNNQFFFTAMLINQRKLKQDIIFRPVSAKEDRTVFPMKFLNHALFLLVWGMKGEYRKRCSKGCNKNYPRRI